MPDFDISPPEPVAPVEPDPPQAPPADPPATPDAVVAAEAARKAAEDALLRQEAETRRVNEAYTALAMQQYAPAAAAAAAPEPALPDPETDPDGYQEARVRQIAAAEAKRVQEQQEQFGAAYRQDRHFMLSYMAQQQKEKMAAKYGASYTELAPKIDEFLKQFPIEQQAQPNAHEEIYFRFIGEQQALEASKANAAVSTAGRTSAAHEPTPPAAPGSTLTDAQVAWSQRVRYKDGPGVSQGTFKEMAGRGVVTLEDWQKMRAADLAAAKKRGA